MDVVRASTFVAEILGDLGKAPSVVVPVVGGHSGVTVRLFVNLGFPTLIAWLADRSVTLAVLPPSTLLLVFGRPGSIDKARPVRR